MRFTIAAFLAVLACCASAARPEKPLAVVADLRYGVALYHYYQGQYRDALAELMVADSRGGVKGHGERPRIMQGGFSLAYGMDRTAGEIFDEVLTTSEVPEVRDAAWYYLGRMRYLRGDMSGAAEALRNITDEPPEDFAEELDVLRINLAIQQGKLDRAHQLLQQSELDDTWLTYLYYNLGAAESRAGNFEAAIPYYAKVADIPLFTEEQRTVYDRAMTAAGYSYLHNQQYQEAQAEFSRVRLASPLSPRAMLGYGWAAAEQEDYVEALAPWQKLAEQPLADENVQEALIAVPFAYEQLGNKRMALEHFQRAQQRLGRAIEVVQAAASRLEDEDAIGNLVNLENGGEFNWLNITAEKHQAPQLAYLADLFARNSFQSQVQELRDLVDIREHTLEWQEKLARYSDLVDEREAARAKRMDYLEQQALSQQIADMRAARDLLAQELMRIREQKDYLALTSGDEAGLHQRVYSVEANIARLDEGGHDVQQAREAHRRFAGLLLWEASEAFADRLWRVQKKLVALDEELQQLQDVHSRIQQAVNAAEDLAPYRQRIAAGQARIERQLGRVDTAIANAQQQLREQILAVLHEQEERLNYYLAQSRLAVARLYDSARVEQR